MTGPNAVGDSGIPQDGASGADGDDVLHSRFLAVIVGALSLGLGVWTVLADNAALGVAAGLLGLVAGLIALLPQPTTGSAGATPSAAAELAPSRRASDRSGVVTTTDVAAFDLTAGDDPDAGADGGPDAATRPQASSDDHLTDSETDLFSEAYLRVALDSRLASARRHLRPVAVALLEVTEGIPDEVAIDAPAQRVADAIRQTVREADIACRMDDGTFAVILEDTPENGAVWTVERIRRNLVSRFGHHTLWAGVACYPAHAFDSAELLSAVRAALDAAKEWKQDRIEVAAAE